MTNKECEHFPSPEGNSVFMVSPFGFPYDEIFENGITKTIKRKLGMNVSRADLAMQLGYVMCQRICRKIHESKYVIVDISLPNANVY
jgi:hypothetical protein